jgi:hypothetical protein
LRFDAVGIDSGGCPPLEDSMNAFEAAEKSGTVELLELAKAQNKST